MRPARPTLLLLTGWLALGLGGALWPALAEAWRGGGLLLAGLLGTDWLAARRPLDLEVERRPPANLAQGAWATVGLTLRNPGKRAYRLAVYDHHPATAEVTGQPAPLRLEPGASARVRYRLRPTRRGEARFGPVEICVRSPLRLWRRYARLPQDQQRRVYPDYAETVKYNLLALDNQLSQLGIRQRQQRGSGLEFHQLRDYREGDSIRRIDWKATARHGKPIARDYQDERDQEVVFLLDCGHRMRTEEDGHSHFDQSLNALLLLAHVALRQGDAVGLHTFGGPRRWLAPRKGTATLNRLLNQLYDLEPTGHGADFTAAVQGLLDRQRKRALLVVLTNIRDEDGDDLVRAVRMASPRHLVMVANLREAMLDRLVAEPVTTVEQSLRYAAAVDLLGRREGVQERLRHGGALPLEATPDQLPSAVVNQYLAIKRSGRL
ncbi:MAG: DUF58 domain-containing protein [Thiohalorhabdus sp.]|uniref:DUF58 domain-containing protein n=1 Tax=Thiohalorhabdus sp. TaxID=3094134 RepID=UPI00398117B7